MRWRQPAFGNTTAAATPSTNIITANTASSTAMNYVLAPSASIATSTILILRESVEETRINTGS